MRPPANKPHFAFFHWLQPSVCPSVRPSVCGVQVFSLRLMSRRRFRNEGAEPKPRKTSCWKHEILPFPFFFPLFPNQRHVDPLRSCSNLLDTTDLNTQQSHLLFLCVLYFVESLLFRAKLSSGRLEVVTRQPHTLWVRFDSS